METLKHSAKTYYYTKAVRIVQLGIPKTKNQNDYKLKLNRNNQVRTHIANGFVQKISSTPTTPFEIVYT